MIKVKTLPTIVTMSLIMTACSGGGGSESSESEVAPTEEASAEEVSAEEIEVTDDNTATGKDSVDNTPMTTKDGIDYASLTGDAAAGKLAFAQCRTCHVTDPGVNRTGPSLAGIVGKEAGSVDGYKYSAANKESGITWTEEQMYVYLEDPQRTIPKTKMIFAGLPDAQKRADLIAYLKDPS